MYLIWYVFCDSSVALLLILFYDLCKAVHNWEVLSVDLYLSFMSRTADIEWCK